MTRSRFRRIAGIDFSGGEQAGAKIWVAEGVVERGRLAIRHLVRADALPGGSKKRQPALAALRRFIIDKPDLIAGCDFPFSLPKPLLHGRDWKSWLLAEMGLHRSADAFRDACRAETDKKEWRRATDREAGTPFCPYNLWLYKQTYWGVTGLLAPLIANAQAVVFPMMEDEPGKPAIIETCPASVLKRWYGNRGNVGYKKRGRAFASRRQEIVSRLKSEGVDLATPVADKAVEMANGDPLDALLAAFATWKAARDPMNLRPRADSEDGSEARVFF